jgi:hypothetical protein
MAYFYFSSGEAIDCVDRTVKIPTLASLTLDQWLDEFNRLKKLNDGMQRPKAGKKRQQPGLGPDFAHASHNPPPWPDNASASCRL